MSASIVVQKENPLGFAPVVGLIRKFALPAIVSMLVNTVYNITDQIFIGHMVGMLGNAATNAVFPIVILSTGLAQLVGIGTAANFNIHMGAKDSEGARCYVGTGLTMSVVLGILLGCLISSSSINLFVVPAHLLSGGIAGIAMIFYYLFSLPIGVQMFLYNLPLLAAAYKTLGREYTLDIAFGTILFSFCVDATRFLNAYAPVPDTMLAAIFGGVLNGIGYGLIFRMNGSSGGFDIVAAIVKKYYSLNMGSVIFAFNCVIMLLAAALFGVMPALYTLICMFMNSAVTDRVVAGFNSRKVVLIISDHVQPISEAIICEVGRGVTFLHGQGAFTRKERNVLFLVCSLTQISKVKLIANLIDKNAFMIVLSANEVMGRGFTMPGMHLKAMLKERSKRIF